MNGPYTRYSIWLRGQECVIPGCDVPGENHHTIPRGMGGGGRDCDQVPICHPHHREGGDIGWDTFEAKYRVNLKQTAAVLYEAYLTPIPPPEED